MAIRNRHRPGYYLIVDDETGLTYYNDQVQVTWDGKVMRRPKGELYRHPQEFVRARNDPVALSLVRDRTPIDTSQIEAPTHGFSPFVGGSPNFDGPLGDGTGVLTPIGPAAHLFVETRNFQTVFGIGWMQIEGSAPAVFEVA